MPAPLSFDHIAVIKLDHAGDVLWTTPAVATLRSNFPSARISVLCTDYTTPIWQHNPAVDDVVAVTGREWPTHLPRPDLALCLDTRTPAVRLTFASRARIRSGYYYFPRGLSVLWPLTLLTQPLLHPASRGDYAHEVEVNRRLLARLGCQTQPYTPSRLYLSETELSDARRLLHERGYRGGDLLAVHLPRKWTDGGWPPEHVARLIGRLADVHPAATLMLSCGPGEEPLLEAIRPLLPALVLPIRGQSFRLWAALLQHCRLLVCRDCGPVHVAAALDVPVISVFEESKRAEHTRWEPWLVPHHNIFRPDVYAEAAEPRFVNETLAAAKQLLQR